MAAYHWSTWQQECCQICEAPKSAQAPLMIFSRLLYMRPHVKIQGILTIVGLKLVTGKVQLHL